MRAPYTGTGIESGGDSRDEYEIDNQEGGKDSELWIRSFSWARIRIRIRH
jgi:hypothetical protein